MNKTAITTGKQNPTNNPTKVNVVVRCRPLQEREKKELEANHLSAETPFEIYPKENAIRLFSEKSTKEDAIVFGLSYNSFFLKNVL